MSRSISPSTRIGCRPDNGFEARFLTVLDIHMAPQACKAAGKYLRSARMTLQGIRDLGTTGALTFTVVPS